MKKLKISKQITATFKQKDDGSYELRIVGRGPTSLEKGVQGDHVTAYALVERGASRIFSRNGPVIVNSSKIRESLKHFRSKRDELIYYMSDIVSIGDADTFEKALKAIRPTKENYDKERFSKTDLFESNKDHSDDERVKRMVKQGYFTNFKCMCDEVAQYVEFLMTQYNAIPKVSYDRTEGLAPPANEGSKILTALNKLDQISQENPSKDPKLIAQHLNSLFFYPPITDDKIKKKSAASRTNNPKELYNSVARHLFIAAKAYPELCDQNNFLKADISKEFIAIIKTSWLGANYRGKLIDLRAMEDMILGNLTTMNNACDTRRVVMKSEVIEYSSSRDPSFDEESSKGQSYKAPSSSIATKDAASIRDSDSRSKKRKDEGGQSKDSYFEREGGKSKRQKTSNSRGGRS